MYSVPKSKNTEIAKKPEIESTTNKEIENVKPTSKTAETPIKDTNLEEKYKKEDKKENQPHIVSISTTFNKSPISDVEVYLQTNAKYIFVCRTNEQGKCLSPLPNFESYTIIAKKPGYTNYSLRITDNTKTRFKINLEKGNDITIQTLLSEDGNKTRLKNAKIYLNQKLEGKTDKQGLFIKNLSYELGEIVDLKIVPSDTKLKTFTTSIVYSSAINIKKTFFKTTTLR